MTMLKECLAYYEERESVDGILETAGHWADRSLDL